MVGSCVAAALVDAVTANDGLEIGVDDRKWSCPCGFVTHNEYVWIEHIHICRCSYGHIVEDPVCVSKPVSRPANDNHATVHNVPLDITENNTSEKIDIQEKITRFKSDDKFDVEWRERRKRVVIAIATAFAIPFIIIGVFNLSTLRTIQTPVAIAPQIKYGDFSKVMHTNTLFEPIKVEIAHKPDQISPFDFRFALKSDWIILPIKAAKASLKVAPPVVDNDDLEDEDLDSDEDQDLDADQDADGDQNPSEGSDPQKESFENQPLRGAIAGQV